MSNSQQIKRYAKEKGYDDYWNNLRQPPVDYSLFQRSGWEEGYGEAKEEGYGEAKEDDTREVPNDLWQILMVELFKGRHFTIEQQDRLSDMLSTLREIMENQ